VLLGEIKPEEAVDLMMKGLDKAVQRLNCAYLSKGGTHGVSE
jgi:hypothetical protein